MPEQLNDITLRSEEVQEILTRVPHWMIRWGSALFLGLILMLLALSWVIKYPDIITSEVVVTTQIPPQKEYAPITADISHMLVSEGDVVTKDQPLAVLEHTGNYEDIFLLKQLVDTMQLRGDTFSFPVDEMPILFLGEVETPFALFENSYELYLLNKELQPFSNREAANRFALSQLRSRLLNLENQKVINATSLDLAKKDEERYRSLYDKGVIASSEYEGKRLSYLQAEQNFKNMNIQISQIKEAISTAGSDSRGVEIDRIREEKTQLKAVIQSFNQLKSSLEIWEQQYVLQADIDGKVSFLQYWTTHQTVTAGELVFTVIPDANSQYIARLKTPLQNSGKVKEGQAVNIKLANYPNAEYGVLNGKVQSISLLPDDDGFYSVNVSLPQTLITSYQKEIVFKQEMRGVANIITEDLRLIDRFFYQFRKLINRN